MKKIRNIIVKLLLICVVVFGIGGISHAMDDADSWYTAGQLGEIKGQIHYGEGGVNPGSGNFSVTCNDMTMNVPGFELNISRTYNSKDETIGLLGRGWRFGLQGSAIGDDLVVVKLPTGAVERFIKNTDGTYKANDSRSRLKKNADGTFEITTKDYYTYGFNTNGWLVYMKDKVGNTVSMTVNTSGKINTIKDEAGRQFSISYGSNGLIERISDPMGRITQYYYNSNNYLYLVIDPTGRRMNYNYDSEGFLLQIMDQNYKVIESLEYYIPDGPDQHKIKKATDANGDVSTYTYNNLESMTTVNENNGDRIWVYWYDESYYITKVQDPEGEFELTSYYTQGGKNYYGEIYSTLDRNGNITIYTRDDFGNVTTVTNPDKSTKSYEYSFDLLSSEKDEMGKYTYYHYDQNTRKLLYKVAPLNGTSSGYAFNLYPNLYAITTYSYYTDEEAQSLGYKAKGLLKSMTDPEGNVTKYEYDMYGNLTKVTDPENNVTQYHYNTIGWKDYSISPRNQRTSFYYNQNGQIEKTTLQNGETTRVTYDATGRKLQEISPNLYNASSDNLSQHVYNDNLAGTRYSYYSSGLIQTKIDAENNKTGYKYDVYGNLITETRQNGSSYQYEYDKMNRLVKVYFKESATAIPVLQEDYSYASYVIITDHCTSKTKTQYLNDTEKAITIYCYDYAGRLYKVINPNGSERTNRYNANGTIKIATTENGATTSYMYDGLNNVTEQWTAFEGSGSSKRYSYTKVTYNKNGKAISVSNGISTVASGYMPVGYETENYTYDGNSRVKSVTNNGGQRTDYAYDPDGNVIKKEVYTSSNTKNTIEYTYNQLGKVLTESVHVQKGDIAGNDINSTVDKALLTEYEYDKNGNLITLTTPDFETSTNDVSTRYTYDKLDRVLTISQPGQDEYNNIITIVNTKTYDWEGKTLTEEVMKGNKTSYTYNPQGHLTKVTDANGGVTAYFYDRAGRRIAEVSPKYYDSTKALADMNRAEFTYDLIGRLKTRVDKYIDPTSGQWVSITSKAYKYDLSGNIIKELDAEGYAAGTGSTVDEKINSGYGTQYTYNLANKLVTTLDPVSKDRGLPATMTYIYDALGRKTQEKNALGIITNFIYDYAGNLTKVETITNQGTDKVTKQYTYDGVGNVLSETDANGNTTTYEYNALNKVRKITTPGNGTMPQNVIMHQYDVLGQLIIKINSVGKVDTYTYDKQGRVRSQTEKKLDGSQAITKSTTYDSIGNKKFEVDGNGTSTEFFYNSLKQLTSTKITVNGVVQNTSYSYDANGKMISTTDWKGNVSTLVYDPLNRMIEKKDAYNNSIEKIEYYKNSIQSKSTDALGNIVQYVYDKNKRLIQKVDGENHSTSFTYDNVGNLEKKKDGKNNTTTYYYDELNHLRKVLNAKGESTLYTYDKNGNVLTQTDGKGNVTTYEYNPANKVVKKIDAGGRSSSSGSITYNVTKVESYSYDSDGNLAQKTDRNGKTTYYTYDIHGNLLTKTVGKDTITFTYDNNGNQLTMADSTGTTTRTFDALNRVTSKTVPVIGTSTYAYDIIANMDSGCVAETTTDPKGNVTTKVFDKDNRLSKVQDGNNTTTYSYYNNGMVKNVAYPDGSKEEYTYYKDSLLKLLINTKADGSTIDSYAYVYDAAHNQTSKTDKKGTTTFVYDVLNRLDTVTEPSGKVSKYTYDVAGNRLSETVTQSGVSIVTTYLYNEQNRLLSTTTLNSGTTEKVNYTYDYNGNMISRAKTGTKQAVVGQKPKFTITKSGQSANLDITFYIYDVWNQLTSVISGSNTQQYKYNGEGYRVEKTINGQTTHYLYESDKVVLEVDNAGNQKARNVYGTNLLVRTVDGETLYYMYNGHADVTALLKTDGTIAGTYYYDPFGNLLEQTGSANNDITYAGYQYDKETGLYYLKARMYDPKIARFMQEDTYRGEANDPLSLNLYTYCSNNPITYSDPTGHWQEGDEKLTYDARVEISRLTDLYYAAKTKQEKDRIHAAATSIRNNPAKKAKVEQHSVTGEDANSILSKTTNHDANGQAYLTASQWNSISTTNNDAIVRSVVCDRKITQTEINTVAYSKPTNVVSNTPKQQNTSVQLQSPNSSVEYGLYKQGINSTQGTGNSSWNQWDISKAASPGNLMGTAAGAFEFAGEVGKELGESPTAASKFGTVAKVAKGAGYAAVVVDVGVGIYDNVQAGEPTKKIVSDAAVDTAFGVGELAASTGLGAAIGSVVPVAGTAVGAGVGLGVGLIYMGVTEIWQPGGKSIKDRAKDGIYDLIK